MMARFLAWLFSDQWLELILDFRADYEPILPPSLLLITIIWSFLGHGLYKNILFRYFFSVVIEGYTRARMVSDLLFSEETIEMLLATWLEYDPDGKGYIEAKQFIDFLVSLKPPLFPNSEDLNKILISLDKELMKIYKPNYPNMHEQVLGIEIPTSRERNSMNLKSRIPYYRSQGSQHIFTVTHFFLLCRLYNIPVYNYNKKT